MTDRVAAMPGGEGAAAEPNPIFGEVASAERIERAARALESNGIRALVAENGAEAKRLVLELIPAGAEVHNATSRTLETIGLVDEIERSGRYRALRPILMGMDRATQGQEMRKLGAAPDFVLGSVHAVTEQGEVVIASASGSQLGPYAAGAGAVIWVIGAQKVVRDLEEALRRVREYSLPLEDERMRKAYGIGSGLNKILIVNREGRSGRTTAIFVRERLGF